MALPDATPIQPHVVIVGGGFGGLAAARALRRAPVRVTLLDRRNHHLFQPLLYQVAMAALSPGDIAAPIRSVLRRQRNVQVLLAEVTGVDLAAQSVMLADGERMSYDYLILAAGGRTSYFGREEWAAIAPGLKTIEDALEIRRRVLIVYEAAERAADPAARQALMTFVVVGGGPTGVELSGAIAEIARFTLRDDFRTIETERTRVILLEGGPRLLATFPKSLSTSAARQLERLGVEIRTGALVTGITPAGVTLTSGEFIEAATVLWAAGVSASPLTATLGVGLDRAGRIRVQPDLSIPGFPTAYAVGDLALFTHLGSRPLPGVAPVAMQAGRAASKNIVRQIQGRPTRRFRYFDHGNMATIGKAAAVADIGPLHLSGLPAWLAWLGVHIIYLIGFANRLLVLTQWAWWTVTHQRGARLITGDPTLPRRVAPPEAEAMARQSIGGEVTGIGNGRGHAVEADGG